ncbi:MAG: DNA polymerase Y family protein [Chloroflexota bacterium]
MIPHFPLEVELLTRPELRGKPVVIGGGVNQTKTVLDCSQEAERWGVAVGLQLRQALARCHEAVFLESRPTVYADVNDRIFQAVYSMSPRVEIRAPGCLYVDVNGLRRSEETLLVELIQAVSHSIGVTPKAGIASGKFPAYAAAVNSQKVRIVPAGEMADFVADLSCTHLPVSAEMRERLRTFGLYTLRDVARLPKGAMLAQFGRDGARAWELSLGLDTEFLRPVMPQEAISDQLDFDEPVSNVGALMEGLRTLLTRLRGCLSSTARAARSIQVRAAIGYGRVWEGRVTFKEPTAELSRMLAAARSVIERQEWVSAVDQLEVKLGGVAVATGTQMELFSTAKQGAHERLDAAVRNLSSHYRRLPVYRLVQTDVQSRIPERRYALTSYLPDVRKSEVRPLGEPRSIEMRLDSGGLPCQMRRNDTWLDVTVIQEEFRVRDEWWSRLILRRYFKVILSNGRYTVLFSEAGRWWLAC